MDWTKLIWAAALIMMAVVLFPAARHWLKHGPRGTSDDWKAAIIPLVLVIGFVFLLITMVRG
ncbi:MAG: hypothetical protein OET44_17680 [Gammaproteobacteria bacterium]|nr:hypothetical protein [Gammaproteobacteria bacterium]